MGRRKILISGAFAGIFLQSGFSAADPVTPIPDARVVDAAWRFDRETIELLVESPHFAGGNDVWLKGAEIINPAFRRRDMLWIAGRLAGKGVGSWNLLGIFDSREGADAACVTEADFISARTLNVARDPDGGELCLFPRFAEAADPENPDSEVRGA